MAGIHATVYVHETIKDCVTHYGVDAIGQSINDTFHETIICGISI